MEFLRSVYQRDSDENKDMQLSSSELFMYSCEPVLRLSGIELYWFIYGNCCMQQLSNVRSAR